VTFGIGYFKSLSNALEVRARIDSVNEKITYAAEVFSIICSHFLAYENFSLGSVNATTAPY
jgi:hypothetical protein